MKLDPKNHDRDVAGLTYVYPVVSRRARGVSLGINLNPNNACNWRCVYCQVPGLVYGNAPQLDLELLRSELFGFLADLVEGDYMERHVPAGSRRLNDVALSGNGEPTSSAQFAEVIAIVAEAFDHFDLREKTKLVLITNGSLVHKEHVQRGLARMAETNGQVWFKLDSATAEGQIAMNSNRAGVERTRTNLSLAAALCPTWIQTMLLERGGQPPSEREQEAYLTFLRELLDEGVQLEGVLLYGLARDVHQPEAAELTALPQAWLEAFAARVRELGLTVTVS